TAIGFATIFWAWSTSAAARIGTLNDLYVAPEGRGSGAAEALIHACLQRCRERGAVRLEWQTALDNQRAQAVYERVGGKREQWLDYSLGAPARNGSLSCRAACAPSPTAWRATAAPARSATCSSSTGCRGPTSRCPRRWRSAWAAGSAASTTSCPRWTRRSTSSDA